MRSVDILIVGQGFAGTTLSRALMSGGAEILVIADPARPPASLAAPALINPVTGRSFVKSWMIDKLIPAAIQTYGEFEQALGLKIIQPLKLMRAFHSEDGESKWRERALDAAYRNYVDGVVYNADIEGIIPFKYGVVNSAFRVAATDLIRGWEDFLLRKGKLLPGELKVENVQHTGDSIRYGDVLARSLVFCDGYHFAKNSLLEGDYLIPNKGEYMICRIPGVQFQEDTALKHGNFIIPLRDNHFWIGSTYERGPFSIAPSEEGKERLRLSLGNILTARWELVEHMSAIRPTVRDRRPILGRHPRMKNIYFFNGLGTKGASLAPFLADRMADFLLRDIPVDQVVALERFF